MKTPTKSERAALSALPSYSQCRSVSPNHAEYERRKAEWILNNPNATSIEYEAAMLRIARECGV
jgi:hypothetical protein